MSLPGQHPLVCASGPPPFAGLVFKGIGGAQQTSAGTFNLSYGTVQEGDDPDPGDLVIWNLIFWGTTSTPPNDISGLGWASDVQVASTGSDRIYHGLHAKIVNSSDLAGPINYATVPTGYGAVAAWIAYSPVGTPGSLTMGGHSFVFTGSSAPSSRSVDSSSLSSPAVAITCTLGVGTDDSISVGGITLDKARTLLNVVYNDWQFGFRADVGGASYTITKADDGTNNMLGAGYLAVS